MIIGFVLLFFSLFEYVVILMITEFKMLLTLELKGRVDTSVIENIPEQFWNVYAIQITISLVLIGISIAKFLYVRWQEKDS